MKQVWPAPSIGRKLSSVTLKRYGAVPVSKCNGGFNPSRAEFGSVGNFAAIVTPKTIAEVFGQADVKVIWMRFAFQDVNVMELHPSLRAFAALRPAICWLAES